VLLANSDKLLNLMHDIDLEGLLAKVRVPPTAEYQDVRDRVEVLIGQLASAGQPPSAEEPDVEEIPSLVE
jgi:hypothetical protein